jgi:N6-L-threonylcarbamoyladenine synthase
MGEEKYILGIDTSCDDTAAAVVLNGKKIISNVVSSQNEFHEKYGGIVPEIASRKHIEMIWPVVDEALKSSGVKMSEIAAIAVCHGPGLIGSLLIGVCFAKSLAFINKIPLLAINHLEGHIYSSFLEQPVPDYPFIALVVSGGHTSIYRINAFGDYTELGRTIDDAAGEAFDKVAKILGLGYPGGPFIDSLSKKGNPDLIPFPRPYMDKGLDFSFSGLKTAVLTHLKKEPGSKKADIAASFQAAVVDVLVRKTIIAAKREETDRIILAGGVSANKSLRNRIQEVAKKEKIRTFLLSPSLCTDNAAMIASAGFYHYQKKDYADMDLNPQACLQLTGSR